MNWTEAEVDHSPKGRQYWIERNGVKVHIYWSVMKQGWVARYDEQFSCDTAEEALKEAEAHIVSWDDMPPA